MTERVRTKRPRRRGALTTNPTVRTGTGTEGLSRAGCGLVGPPSAPRRLRQLGAGLAISAVLASGCSTDSETVATDVAPTCAEQYESVSQAWDTANGEPPERRAWIAGCNGDTVPYETSAETIAPSSEAALGGPVSSGVGSAVVPENTVEGSSGFFEAPPGVGASEVIAWYEANMPPGKDFGGMTWLEALPDAFDAVEDWYWCVGPGQSVDVAIYDDGSIGVAQAAVTDGACG